MRKHGLVRVLKVAAIAVAGITVFGFVVERLWNWLAPAIFGARTITFWQALGVLLLSKILFGGFHRHARRGDWRRRMNRRMDRRWAAMSPAEQERFKQGLRRRGGCRWNQGSPTTAPAEETAQ